MTAWTADPAGRPTNARSVGVAVAKVELQRAEQAVLAARAAVQVSKAEALAIRAERLAGRATLRDVLEAQRRHSNAKRAVRAAVAAVQARRAQVDLARLASRGHPSTLPLAQVLAAHDAVTAAWMSYETDTAKLIAFPAMTDVRHAPTATFVRQQRAAIELRPARDARITADQFLAYRDAVGALQAAFAAAEQHAWALAQEDTRRQELTAQAQRAEEARRRHAAARATLDAELRTSGGAQHPASQPTAPPAHPPTPPSPPGPVWPVPSRTRPSDPQ